MWSYFDSRLHKYSSDLKYVESDIVLLVIYFLKLTSRLIEEHNILLLYLDYSAVVTLMSWDQISKKNTLYFWQIFASKSDTSDTLLMKPVTIIQVQHLTVLCSYLQISFKYSFLICIVSLNLDIKCYFEERLEWNWESDRRSFFTEYRNIYLFIFVGPR